MKIIIKSTDKGVIICPSTGKLSDINGLPEALTRYYVSYNDKFASILLDDNGNIEKDVTKVHRILEEHSNINLFINDVTFEYLLNNRKVVNIDGEEVNLYAAVSTAVGVLGSLSPTDNLHYMYRDDTKIYLSSKIFKDNDKITFESIKGYQLLILENDEIDNDSTSMFFNPIKSFTNIRADNNDKDRVKLSLISNT